MRLLWEKDKGICHLCLKEVPWIDPIEHNTDPDRPTKDHVIPRGIVTKSQLHFKNGLGPDNLKLAHYKCNHSRGTLSVEEYRRRIGVIPSLDLDQQIQSVTVGTFSEQTRLSRAEAKAVIAELHKVTFPFPMVKKDEDA